jgi:imidazolonepropionase-like amidohydrolase
MRALAAAGLTNADVLAAATRNGAVAVGAADRIGRLAIGMAADAIVVRGNPLDSLGNLSDPLLVVAAGRVVVNRLTDHGMRLDDPPDPAGEGLFSVTVRWEGA